MRGWYYVSYLCVVYMRVAWVSTGVRMCYVCCKWVWPISYRCRKGSIHYDIHLCRYRIDKYMCLSSLHRLHAGSCYEFYVAAHGVRYEHVLLVVGFTLYNMFESLMLSMAMLMISYVWSWSCTFLGRDVFGHVWDAFGDMFFDRSSVLHELFRRVWENANMSGGGWNL